MWIVCCYGNRFLFSKLSPGSTFPLCVNTASVCHPLSPGCSVLDSVRWLSLPVVHLLSFFWPVELNRCSQGSLLSALFCSYEPEARLRCDALLLKVKALFLSAVLWQRWELRTRYACGAVREKVLQHVWQNKKQNSHWEKSFPADA